jgi:linoleoyl-CoA desaturase
MGYGADTGFHQALRTRVQQHLEATGQAAQDLPAIYLKTAVLFTWLSASYILLVFVAEGPWQAVPLAVSLALAIAGVGFNVQHDGSHGSYSAKPAVNKLMARSLDLLGGSSFVWQRKHNVLHHTWPNVEGVDDDIDTGSLARLSPGQPRRAYHRFQHFYMWPLYCFLAVKWQLHDDFRTVVRGSMSGRPFPRPRGTELLVFLGGKLVFFSLAFGLPLLLHPLWTVLGAYLLVAAVAGLTLSVVFQLAHCVPEAETGPELGTWAARQVQASVDFARDSRLLNWYVGGLNLQIEHHLFPQISHPHYPALAPIVEATCREFGVRYTAHPTLAAAVTAHFRQLRALGRSDEPARAASQPKATSGAAEGALEAG